IHGDVDTHFRTGSRKQRCARALPRVLCQAGSAPRSALRSRLAFTRLPRRSETLRLLLYPGSEAASLPPSQEIELLDRDGAVPIRLALSQMVEESQDRLETQVTAA